MDEEQYFILFSKLNSASKIAFISQLNEDNCDNKKIDFDLHKYSDQKCKFYFRFTKQEICRLSDCFKLPHFIRTDERSKFHHLEALCILLRRLSYPNRLGDLQLMFHRTKSQLSRIIKWMLNYLDTNFGFLLETMELFWLQSESLEYFANKIQEKGSPLRHCVGFIDGTVRPFCRPKYNQKQVYNGHKRTHGIKFQSVVTPNGIISNLFGPVEGRRHDAYMLRTSGLLAKLEVQFQNLNGNNNYCLYGDPAYPIRPQLIAPFKGSNLSEDQRLFNKCMSEVRQSVEWEFGRVLQLFAFLDFKKNLKLYLQPVALYYRVGALLGNCHACLHDSITSTYFGVRPPTLEQYLGNNKHL